MCNLYSITTDQAAIAALFGVMNQHAGNLPTMPRQARFSLCVFFSCRSAARSARV
jgi:hypothetical protein